MSIEREHLHRFTSSTTSSSEHDEVSPGRSSRSALLRKPDHAVPSGLLLRKARDANGVADGAEHAVSAASSSSGSSLPAAVQRKFESSLGADLSAVRVHTGSESAAANDAVGARAYTMGNDIHFGAGQYDPTSASGEHLLAHEVAHTVQQSGMTQRMQFKLAVSSPGDALEHEADRAADAMVSGQPANVSSGASVHRKVMREAFAYQQWLPAKSVTSEVDKSGNAAAAKAGELPIANVPTEYATKRAAYFDSKIQQLLQVSVPGVMKSEMQDTEAMRTLVEQKKSFLADVNTIENANQSYNYGAESANLAGKALARNMKLRASLGFYGGKDIFQKNLNSKQQDALKTSIQKHPELLAGTSNISILSKEVDSTRHKLIGAELAYKNWAIGTVIAQLEAQKKEAADKKEEIEKKIATVRKIAGGIQTGVQMLATAGKWVDGKAATFAEEKAPGDSTAKTVGEGAEFAASKSETLDLVGVAEFGAQLYFQKDLDALNAKIEAAKTSIGAMTEIQASNDAVKVAEDLAGAKDAYTAACEKLGQAVSDRRKAYAAIAKEADGASGGKSKDSISQVMLYMSSVRETKGLLDAGYAAATTTLGTMTASLSTLGGHRGKDYYTAESFYVPVSDDTIGPDQKAMRSLIDALTAWLANAKDEKATLTDQAASAQTLMSGLGAGNY